MSRIFDRRGHHDEIGSLWNDWPRKSRPSKPGDTVKAEQSLITAESDKASMEIPSSHAGVVKDIKIKLGNKVKQGSVVLTLEAAGAVWAICFRCQK